MDVDNIILLSHSRLKNSKNIATKIMIYSQLTPILNKMKKNLDRQKFPNNVHITYHKRITYVQNIIIKYKLNDVWEKYLYNIKNSLAKKFDIISNNNNIIDISIAYLRILKIKKTAKFNIPISELQNCEKIITNKIDSKNKLIGCNFTEKINDTNLYCEKCSYKITMNIERIIFLSNYIQKLQKYNEKLRNCIKIPVYNYKLIDCYENPNEISRKKNTIYNLIKAIENIDKQIENIDRKNKTKNENKIIFCMKNVARKLSIEYLNIVKYYPQNIMKFVDKIMYIFRIPKLNFSGENKDIILYLANKLCLLILQYPYYNKNLQSNNSENKIVKLLCLLDNNNNDINLATFYLGKVLGYIISL